MASLIQLERDADGNLLPFKTKNHKYTPIQAGSPIGINRWTQYEKLRVILGTGHDFISITDTLRDVEKMLAADKPFDEIRLEAILLINSLRRGVVDLSKARFNKAFYMATLFILRDGDDLKEWTVEKAEDYIEDWQAAGVNEEDLFFFALGRVAGFKERYREMRDQISREQAALLAITGSKDQTEEASADL